MEVRKNINIQRPFLPKIGTLLALEKDPGDSVSRIISKRLYSEGTVESGKAYSLGALQKIYEDPEQKRNIFSFIFNSCELRAQSYLNRLTQKEIDEVIDLFFQDITALISKMNLVIVSNYLANNDGSLRIFDYKDVLQKLFPYETDDILKKYRRIMNHVDLPFLSDSQLKIYEDYLSGITPQLGKCKIFITGIRGKRQLKIPLRRLEEKIRVFKPHRCCPTSIVRSHRSDGSVLFNNKNTVFTIRSYSEILQILHNNIGQSNIVDKKESKKVARKFQKETIFALGEAFGTQNFSKYLMPDFLRTKKILEDLRRFLDNYREILNDENLFEIRFEYHYFIFHTKDEFRDMLSLIDDISKVEELMNVDILN